jgi:hypothetical protein
MAKRHSRPSRQYRYEHYDSSGRPSSRWDLAAAQTGASSGELPTL